MANTGATLQRTKTGKPRNYQSVVHTPALRAKQRNAMYVLPSGVGGIYGGLLGGLPGAAAGAGIGAAAGHVANRRLDTNRKAVAAGRISPRKAHLKNQRAMKHAIYSSLYGGAAAGFGITGLGMHFKGEFKDLGSTGGLMGGELEDVPKSGRVNFKGGRRTTSTTIHGIPKGFLSAIDDNEATDIHPWADTKVHTETWGIGRRGKMFSKTQFPEQLSHSWASYKRGETPHERMFRGEKSQQRSRDWQSITNTVDKSHTHYNVNALKVGAVGAGVVAAAGAGYYGYRHRADIAKQAHNINQGFHNSAAYHSTRDFYYRRRNGKQQRVRKGKRNNG